MTKRTDQIEQLFRDRLTEYAPTPSPGVWRGVNRRLWIRDFVRPSVRKFNVYYILLLLGTVGLLTATLSRPGAHQSTTPVMVNQKNGSSIPKVNGSNTGNSVSDGQPPQTNSPSTLSLRARFSIESSNLCSPAMVQFTNNSEGASTYLWQFGDGTTSDESHPLHTFSKAGKYTVSLTAKDAQGKSSTVRQQIEVLSAPEARFKIDVNGSSKAQKIVQFTNLSEGAASYRWDFGDTQQSSETHPRHMYAKNGTYQISLMAIGTGQCSDTMVLATKYLELECGLLFPNVFYPSTEGPASAGSNRMQKSIFLPEYQGVTDYKLVIFDSHGRLVFETNRLDAGWNGYVERRLVPAGSYKWEAKGRYANDEPFSIRGEVKVVYDQTYNSPTF